MAEAISCDITVYNAPTNSKTYKAGKMLFQEPIAIYAEGDVAGILYEGAAAKEFTKSIQPALT